MRNVLVILIGLIFVPSLHAAVIQVPGDAPDIQTAIDQAVDGDIVQVAPGIYPGPIDFLGKRIRVESLAGPEQTLIDGQGHIGYVVRFESGEDQDSVLSGFTVTGGFGELGSNGAGPGGGISILDASPTLTGNLITANIGGLGGGIYLAGGEPVLTDNRIEANHAGFGGGIYVEGGRLTISGGHINENVALTSGGGIAVLWAESVTLDQTQLLDNLSHNLGGAMWLNNTELQAQRLRISDNGRVQVGDWGSISLQPLAGGAIYAANTSGQLNRARLIGNAAFAGSAVYLAGNSTLSLVNVLATSNHAAQGTVYANGTSPILTNVTLVENEGAGIFTTFNAFPVVNNSIVAGNASGEFSNEIAGNGTVQLSFSLLGGNGFGFQAGPGVITGDPQLDASSDYRPMPGSPVIDAGDNDAVPEGILHDLPGHPRFINDPDTPDTGNGVAPIVDMGAVEYLPAHSSRNPTPPVFVKRPGAGSRTGGGR